MKPPKKTYIRIILKYTAKKANCKYSHHLFLKNSLPPPAFSRFPGLLQKNPYFFFPALLSCQCCAIFVDDYSERPCTRARFIYYLKVQKMKLENLISEGIFDKRALSERQQDLYGPRRIALFSGPEELKWETISLQKHRLR